MMVRLPAARCQTACVVPVVLDAPRALHGLVLSYTTFRRAQAVIGQFYRRLASASKLKIQSRFSS
jgi:hypothetical protein